MVKNIKNIVTEIKKDKIDIYYVMNMAKKILNSHVKQSKVIEK